MNSYHELSPADRRELAREMLTVVDAFMRSSPFLQGVRELAPVAVPRERCEAAAPLSAPLSSNLPPELREVWMRHVERVVDDALARQARSIQRVTARDRLGWVIRRFGGRRVSYPELARQSGVSHVAIGKWVKQFVARLVDVPEPAEGATRHQVLEWLLDLLRVHLERRDGFAAVLAAARAPVVGATAAVDPAEPVAARVRRSDRP